MKKAQCKICANCIHQGGLSKDNSSDIGLRHCDVWGTLTLPYESCEGWKDNGMDGEGVSDMLNYQRSLLYKALKRIDSIKVVG